MILEVQWLQRNVIDSSTNVYLVDKDQEICCIICTILELFSDLFLIIYLFIGRTAANETSQAKGQTGVCLE